MKVQLTFIVFILLLTACVKEIGYDNNSIEPQIGYNIYANFTNVLEEQAVIISNVTSLSDTASVLGEAISGAEVRVESDRGAIISKKLSQDNIFPLQKVKLESITN